MVKINQNYGYLKENYLFSEISQRVKIFTASHPGIQIYSLGIGNTTRPLPQSVIKGLLQAVKNLSVQETYSGYGDESGNLLLRRELVNFYKKRKILLDMDEIFISDGAKSDISNIQSLFDINATVAIEDPVYPVYVDSNILAGRRNFVYLNANKENGFFPTTPTVKVDIIYLCSPNNPTGAVATVKDLQGFVDYARKNNAIIIFDGAYEAFIKDKNLPHSIYEIEGSKECAIEINSFSKSAGFTGVRLGWTIVPKELVAENGKKSVINRMWFRRIATTFNGASNISQAGGLAVLSTVGQTECKKTVRYYMRNAAFIASRLKKMGFTFFGGENAPYIWLQIPKNYSSWDFFDMLLQKAHVVVTPGIGFGKEGKNYVRLSAFGSWENTQEAIKNIEKNILL